MSDVRTRLIDASFQEVYAHGYNGASLATILNAAGVKKGAMYHYFSSKKEMVLAMINEKLANLLNIKWEKFYSTESNILDTFIEMLEDESDWNYMYGCPLGNLLLEPLDYDEDFANSLTHILSTWQEGFAIILQQAKDTGQIKEDVNIEESAIFLIASIEGMQLLSKKTNDPTYFKKCINQLTIYLNTLRSN